MQECIRKAAAVLHAAALGQEPSSTALAHVVRLVGGDSAAFINWNGLSNGSQPFETFNAPPELVLNYATSFANRDAQMVALTEKWGTSPPPVFVDDEVLPRQTLLKSDIFNEFWKPMNIHHLIVMQSRHEQRIGINSMRLLIGSGAAKQGFGAYEKRLLMALSPHFNTAAMLFSERRTLAHASVAAAFEHAADAMAILDQNGRLRYTNNSFEALRRSVDPNWHRYYSAPLESPAFRLLKAEFDAVLMETRVLSLSARRFNFDLYSPKAFGTPKHFAGFIATTLTHTGVKGRNREAQYLLVLREAAALRNEKVLALRRRHRLTPAETRVLQGFAQGSDLNTIAASLGITIHTVRLHMKSLLSKTGCRRQAELARQVETTPTGSIRIET